MNYVKYDEDGAYVDIPDDDRDLVTLMKIVGAPGFFYRIRGDFVEKAGRLEKFLRTDDNMLEEIEDGSN